MPGLNDFDRYLRDSCVEYLPRSDGPNARLRAIDEETAELSRMTAGLVTALPLARTNLVVQV